MANEYIRKEWDGGVVRTTLNGAINAGAVTITLTDGSSFPSGVNPFVIVIDRGQATEEKVLVNTRTGNSLAVLQRGYDGSSAQSHSTGAYVEHALDAYTVNQANAMATTMTTQGDIIYKTVTGDNVSFGRLGLGTSGYPLVATGTAPAYQQVGSTGIANDAVVAGKIAADVAGNGLSRDGTTKALQINVDDSSIAIVFDALKVKDGGITSTHILNGTIVDADISAAAAIDHSKLAGVSQNQILVGNIGGVLTARTLSGDVTIQPGGVTQIESGVIVNADISTASGQPAGAWTTFTQATSRTADSNITSLALAGAYQQLGKTVRFRMQISGTAATASSVAVGLPSVIGTTVDYVQPACALISTGGVNKKVIACRVDPNVGPRVQFYSDADGTGFTSGSITVTVVGTFEVA